MPDRVVQLNDLPQVGIIGQTLKFDSAGTQTLNVRWSIIGCGKRALGGTLSPTSYALPNIAVDVYLNKWVQILFFFYLEVTQRSTSVTDAAFSYDPYSFPTGVQLPSGRQGGLP